MATAKAQFLAASGIREEIFELKHNNATLAAIVRIHPARRYREIIAKISDPKYGFELFSEQFLTIEDHKKLFTAKEFEDRLPDVFVQKLCNVFVKANTGVDPSKEQPGEDLRGGVTSLTASHGSSSPSWSEFGILTRLKIAAHIVFCRSGRTI